MSILRRICCKSEATISIAELTNFKWINKLPQLSTTAATNSYVGNSKQANPQNTESKADWTVIYRLPLVRWASAFNRLKIYQGAVSIAGIPATFMLEEAAIIPAGFGVTFATVGLTSLVTLLLSSLVVKNLIGFIYINTNGNRLKFAYVDYWGRRKDIVLDIDELVPDGAQLKPTRLNFFQIISIKNNEKCKFKLLQRYGIITNNDVFYALFY